MNGEIKHFLRKVFVYSSGKALTFLFSLASIKITTNLLSLKGYGLLQVANSITNFFFFIFPLSIDSAVTRFFFHRSDSSVPELDWRKHVSSSAFFFKIFTFLIGCSSVILSHRYISEFLFGREDISPENLKFLFYSVSLYIFLNGLYSSIINFPRLEGNARKYSALEVIFSFSSVVLVFFLLKMKPDPSFVFISNSLSILLVLIFLLPEVKRYISFRFFDVSLLKNMLRFSIPLVPSAVSYYAMGYLDRYFLVKFDSLESVAFYGVATSMGKFLTLATMGFFTAWGPFVFGEYEKNKEKAKRNFSILFLYVGVFLTLIAGLFTCFSYDVIPLITHREYLRSADILPFVFSYTIIFMMGDYFCVGISIKKKTEYRMYGGIISLFVNFILNLLLVPKFKIWGAVSATFISYLVYSSFVLYQSQKLFSLRYSIWVLPLLLASLFIIHFTVPYKLLYRTLSFLILIGVSLILLKRETKNIKDFYKI